MTTGQGEEFKTRLTEDYNPAKKTGDQDHQFPKDLSFENQFAGFEWYENESYFNVIMSDGTRGQVPKTRSVYNDLKFSKADPISKITIYYSDIHDYPYGYKFFSKTGECLLTAGTCTGKTKDMMLQEGERIVGMKSRIHGNYYHCDVQFIIGGIE